ncbi:MAG: gephyrin-like molybdotransferase Glp [Pseudomonadota bacterium]
MKRFFKVKTVEEVLHLINLFAPLASEEVDLAQAAGRVLAKDVSSEEDIPDFERSAMDGYAVRARDTFGATEGLPALFEVVGEVHMGQAPGFEVGPGRTARIWTGGMLPQGADAVVMIEYARVVDESTVELARPVAPYDHVIRRGEDLRRGEVLIKAGRRLRPQDVGLLAALGRGRLAVIETPKVAIVSTGDEIVPLEDKPGPGQVRDVNTYTLAALISQAHGRPISLGLVKDEPEALRQAVSQGLAQADVVLISGGSSVGVRDYTVEVLESFEGSEILVHGVSVSPGKPTIMARVGRRSLWGLPGHTVSAMITCDLFIRPLLRRLSGESAEPGWGRSVWARLSRNVPSVHGRQDYVRVRLENGTQGITAYPVLGKSGLISTMVKADGLIVIGLNEEGLRQGARVEVFLFQ